MKVNLAIFSVLVVALLVSVSIVAVVILKRCSLFSVCNRHVEQDTRRLVPALYVFGDSTVDAGNNNNLRTMAKADYLPYGVDFNHTATGRFTNGRTSADFIASYLGLPFPPAYMNLSESARRKITTGLNYASGSCGILPDTGASQGSCLALDNQTDLFRTTVDNLDVKNREMQLAKSIFFISLGSNDYVLNYFLNSTDMQKRFSPEHFAKFLSTELTKRLQKLYDLGARKFLVSGAPAVGCIPANAEEKGECVESMDQAVALYNEQLFKKLKKLQSRLPGSIFTHSDIFKFLQELIHNREKYGITNVTSACWDLNNGLCPNRDKYVYFDRYHATQVAYGIYASRCLNESSICSPLNIMQLVLAA